MRVISLDVAKGIGIFLVVLKHNSLLKEHAPIFFDAISTFNVPLFFLLSGAFLPQRVTAAFAWHRLQILSRPFAVGVLLALPLQLIDLSHPVNDWFPLGVFWATGNSVMNAPLWFLTSLTAAVFFLSLTEKLSLTGTRGALVGGALFLFGLWLMSIPEIRNDLPKDQLGRFWGLPWSVDIVLIPLGLMMSGRALGRFLQTPLNTPLMDLALLASFLGLFLWGFSAGRPALDLNNRMAVHVWPLLGCALSGMGMVLSLSRCITYLKGAWIASLQKLGANSLIVLICHWPLQQVFIRIFKRFEHNTLTELMISVLACVLTYLFAMHIVAPRPLLRKWFTGRA
ncbi:acyltransferase family protein [Aquabacterium sp. NJ1]|uniref:acyltransferase family protein n=1 Tax=Aquabacterium sp. NJ1 TaxID=1538295 RepID=UPI0013781BCA|nr:acyltransferase family protein [Aquabacterium sp. NJ1]